MPTLVKELKEKVVVQVSAGKEHSVCLTADGDIYTWGSNEEGQCGVGDTFGDYRKLIKDDPSQEQKNMNYIRFFKRPELLDTLPEGNDIKISKIFAG